MNGQQHKRHRRVVMAPFLRKTFAGYVQPISQILSEMLAQWRLGELRDLHEDMTHFMLRVTSSLLFGFDQPETAYRLGRMIDRWVGMNHATGLAAIIPNEHSLEHYDELLHFAGNLELEIREMIARRRAESGTGMDVLSILLNAFEGEDGLTDDELVGHVALLFGAAHLTTAHSITWLLFLLAQHPPIAHRLCEELPDIVTGAPLRLEDIERLAFLERVVKEGLRILPGSAYVQRVNVNPVELGPFQIPRGTVVFFSQFITHHMSEIYASPERFDPDRWLHIKPPPYGYLPFGAGPRLCIGGPLAEVIIKIALVRILQHFRFHVVPDAEINGRAISTMLTPTNGMPMTIAPLESEFRAVPVSGNIREMVDLAHVERRNEFAQRRKSAKSK